MPNVLHLRRLTNPLLTREEINADFIAHPQCAAPKIFGRGLP
jgi:hypothetical protein